MLRATNSFRTAINSGAWAEAEQILIELRGEVDEAWHAASDEKARQRLQQEVGDLLEWARKTTLAARAHTRDNIIQLQLRRAYAAAKHIQPDGLSLDA